MVLVSSTSFENLSLRFLKISLFSSFFFEELLKQKEVLASVAFISYSCIHITFKNTIFKIFKTSLEKDDLRLA